METTHTPGPWRADLGETYSVRASDGRVAYCQHVHLAGRRDAATVAANARLIASAPELLEALVDFQAHVVRHSCTWDDAESGSHHHPIWQKVADAIAKARGEA